MLNLTFKGGAAYPFGESYVVPSVTATSGRRLNKRNLAVVEGNAGSISYRVVEPNSEGSSVVRVGTRTLTISNGAVSDSLSSSQSLPSGFSNIQRFCSIRNPRRSPDNQESVFTIHKKNYCILRRSSDGNCFIFRIDRTSSSPETFTFVNTGIRVTDVAFSVFGSERIQFVYYDNFSGYLYVFSERPTLADGTGAQSLIVARIAVTGNDVNPFTDTTYFTLGINRFHLQDFTQGWWVCFETNTVNDNILKIVRTVRRVIPNTINAFDDESQYRREMITINAMPGTVHSASTTTYTFPVIRDATSSVWPEPGESIVYTMDFGNVVIEQNGRIRPFNTTTAAPITDVEYGFSGPLNWVQHRIVRDLRDFV